MTTKLSTAALNYTKLKIDASMCNGKFIRVLPQQYAVSYQVGGQPEEVGDPMVVRGLITAASLDEHSNLGGWGIVFQGGDHQSTGQSGHLRTHIKMSFSIIISIKIDM